MKLKTLDRRRRGLGLPLSHRAGQGPVKIGFITDMSSLYADIDGPGGAEMPSRWPSTTLAARCWARPLKVVTADHQNKADIASRQGA
jgi:branched-chain amino acid transport system substrate-binding protein